MDDNLVGYLLHSLDPEDHRAVEAELQARPELRARLDLLERALSPLAADRDGPAPPPGLWLGAVARMAEHRCRSLPAAPPPTPYQRSGRSWRTPRRADLLVAAGLLLVLGGLAAPGLARLWRSYENRSLCANNLRVLSNGLHVYSDSHSGTFPGFDADGSRSVAGSFVPVLHDAGALPVNANLVCPAEASRAQPPRHHVPDLDDLFRNRREEFDRTAPELAGSYAYSLGYQDGRGLQQLRPGDDDARPIVADRVPCLAPGNSPNHGGSGQNVLYVGGHVRWHTNRNAGVGGDDIYLNQKNEPSAGLGRDDSVLGCSEMSPFPRR
jgi:hypothetical protein